MMLHSARIYHPHCSLLMMVNNQPRKRFKGLRFLQKAEVTLLSFF